MTKDDIFEKIKEILIQEFEIDGKLINPTASLFADLDFDSIDAVDLIVKMKPYVSGKIDPELFKNTRTIQDVVDILFPLVQEVP
ncbi:acyl carrier protein [Treponema primitia]|uniref:acyl carrier protein n=1 Tax=Treponema primitia TaxID=88058 RepID=UPI0002554CC0|nr:acyl carrier protein [Treponema primitia]